MKKIWTLRLLAGAAVVFVTAAPVSVENAAMAVPGDGLTCAAAASVTVDDTAPAANAALPCEGSKFGCGPMAGGTWVIRYGKDCSKIKLRDGWTSLAALSRWAVQAGGRAMSHWWCGVC